MMVNINKVLRGLTPLTARSIIKFIGSKEAGDGVGWFSGKELDKIFGDETRSISLQEKLNNIQQKFEDNRLFTSIKAERTYLANMHTRLFQAEMDICLKFQRLQKILANGKRDSNVKRLQYEILNPDYGILNNLSVIHQELIGQTLGPSNKGLLEIWYNEVCDSMNENPISARTCYEIVMNHLTKAAILQLKGFLLFQGATEDAECLKKFKYVEHNLKYQCELMDETISDAMKYLADPNKENEFYLRKVSGVRFKPFVKYSHTTEQLMYEYNLKYTAEEKWIFEKSSRFKEDGSLIISGFSTRNGDKRSYIGLKGNNKAVCVSEKAVAQPFFIMPIDKIDSTTITIWKCNPESNPARFLGNNLEFVKDKHNIEFTMTKPENTSKEEHTWDSFYECKRRPSPAKPI